VSFSCLSCCSVLMSTGPVRAFVPLPFLPSVAFFFACLLMLISPTPASTESKLVPDMLSQFMPSAVLSVMFGQNDANYGQALTIDQVKEQPTVMVNPAQNATDMFNSESTWTVAMVDPGVVGKFLRSRRLSSPALLALALFSLTLTQSLCDLPHHP
jgi:hypothetical protein